MPLGSTAYWAVVVPVGDRINIHSNPSWERGTVGAFAITGAALGSLPTTQVFGAWHCYCTPGINGTSGGAFGSWISNNGTTYSVSAYVNGADTIPYRMAVADSSGLNFVSGGTTTFTGGGTWQRYSLSYTEAGGGAQTRTLVVTKAGDANVTTFRVDGCQAEAGALTTYFDGDQEGAYWLGDPHASLSMRSGTYRGGGTVIALADLGLKPDDMLGVGMPPQDVLLQSYALLPGAEYQRSRAGERTFALTFKPIVGTTLQGFHVTRRTILNAIKPGLTDPQQPIRFWYTGGQGTVQIDAVYQAGMELGEMNGPMAEEGAIRFVAPDPYWSLTTDMGTTLAPRTVLGSTNFLAWKDPYGRWGTMGASGSATNNTVFAVEVGRAGQGTIFLGGDFLTAGGTTAPYVAMFFTETNKFGTVNQAAGTLTNTVRALQWLPSGSLIVGGAFTKAGGSTASLIAQLTPGGSWGTLTQQGGTVTGAAVYDLLYLPTGSLIVGGDFSKANGTTARYAALYSNAAWGTLKPQASNGTINDVVLSLAQSLDGRTVYLGGQFGSAGGTPANLIASWSNGSFGTLGAGMQTVGGGNQVAAMVVGRDAILSAFGEYGSAGGGTSANAAQWNGVQWFRMGSGIGGGVIATTARSAALLPNNDILVGHGGTVLSGIDYGYRSGLALFNGNVFLPNDLIFESVTTTYPAIAPSGTLYLGGDFIGIGTAASVGMVVNAGMADAYPTIRMRNTSNTAAIRVYQLINTYPLGARVHFNLVVSPGEVVTFETNPEGRALTSSYRTNIFGAILAGSNLTSFYLAPGTNYLSFLADSDSLETSIYWRSRSDSIDGGTIY